LQQLEPEVTVAGNHDWGVLDKQTVIILPDGTMQGDFGADDIWAIRRHQYELSMADYMDAGRPDSVAAQMLAWSLVSVPVPGVFAIHGGADKRLGPSPTWELGENLHSHLWGYVKEAQHVEHTFEVLDWLIQHPEHLQDLLPAGASANALDAAVVAVVGHYHKRRFARLSESGVVFELDLRLDSPYALDAGLNNRFLISPGSVGFPDQNRNRDACYAVLELQDNIAVTVTFHGVPYDRKDILMRLRNKKFPDTFVQRLAD
jgi:hypothetical protein